jgi:hypothetical protein
MNKVLSIKYGKRIGLLTVLLLATGYLILNTAPAALAQETQRTYTITPPTITQKLNPGQNAEGVLKVYNNTDQSLTFTTSIKDFIVEDTLGTPQFLPNNTLSNKYSAASWIGVTPSTFTIAPHQRQELNYYIHAPANARPGGHYAAVTYSPSVNLRVSGTGASVNTEAGSLFYIEINGPITEKSFVSKFFANPFQEYGPVNILTQIKNLGDLHITPQGSITVTGLLFNQTQNLANHNIFPEAARDYQNTFGQTWMIGRYKAVFLASYGRDNNLPLMATVYFWVFPWRLAVVIVLAIIALVLATLYLRRRKTSHEQPDEAKVSETSSQPTEIK